MKRDATMVTTAAPRLVERTTAAHLEYPIEQRFRSADREVGHDLMQRAWQRAIDPQHALFFAEPTGLRVLGRSEPVLARVSTMLRRRLGAGLVAEAPRVRYAPGVPLREPYMLVLVNAPPRHVERVRDDLFARHGRVTRVVDPVFVLEGEAPLARLIGYYANMRAMLASDWERSYVATSLSRYVAVDDDGPRAA